MAINFLGLPQHFENTEQLREATRQNLISEPEYKKMSGYDASQNIWGLGDLMGPYKPAANLAASGIYNLGKSIFAPDEYFDPETYQARIGPLQSVGYNVEGALALSPELQKKYEAILDLDRKSLTGNWMPEDLHDFPNVSADKKGTIVPDDRVMHSGFNFQIPRIFSELKAEEAPLFDVDKVRDMIAKSRQDGPWKMRSGEDDLMNYNEHYNTPIVEAPTGAAAGLEALKPFVPGAALRFLNSMIRPGADQSAMGIGGLYGDEVDDINFARQYGDPDVTRLLGSDPRVDPYGKNIVSGARNYNQGVKDWVDKYGDVTYKTDFMKKKQQYYKDLVQNISRKEEQRAIEEARARSRAATARQQQALASSQDWTGASSDYRGGDDTPQGRATGNYHDPYDPGHAD